jgi:hypothetical protein
MHHDSDNSRTSHMIVAHPSTVLYHRFWRLETAYTYYIIRTLEMQNLRLRLEVWQRAECIEQHVYMYILVWCYSSMDTTKSPLLR